MNLLGNWQIDTINSMQHKETVLNTETPVNDSYFLAQSYQKILRSTIIHKNKIHRLRLIIYK